MTPRAHPRKFLVRPVRRLLLAGLLALTVAATSQAAADTLTVAGNINVTFTALGSGQLLGTPTLAYAAAGPVPTFGAAKRAVTVRLLQPLPPGVTMTVSFVPDAGRGLSTGTVTLSTVAQVLVDLIDPDTEQTPKALHYTLQTSRGFSGLNINVEYVLTDR